MECIHNYNVYKQELWLQNVATTASRGIIMHQEDSYIIMWFHLYSLYTCGERH